MSENSFEPPAIDAYYDFVVNNYEDELTAEGISLEAKFMREIDKVKLRASETPEETLEQILATLRDGTRSGDEAEEPDA